MAETLTQKWLRQNVGQYAFHDRVYADIDAALASHSTLRPKSDVYTYDDGRTQLLLCLHGLLPISFRGASYHIPIAVWITREYPRQPPMVYVVPTNDMLVKPSQYLDVSGRSNIEYLQAWERKYEGCNLVALLDTLQDHFSRDPPVYAKPKAPASIYPSAVHSPPVPPKPGPSTSISLSGPPLSHSAPPASSHSQSPPHVIPPQTNAPIPVPARPPLPPQFPYSSPDLALHQTPSPHDPRHNAAAPPPLYPGAPSPVPVHVSPGIHPASQAPPVTQPWTAPPPPPHHNPVSPVGPNLMYPPQPVPPSVIPNLIDEDPISEQSSPQPAIQPVHLPPRPPNPELLQLHARIHQKLASDLASLTQALAADAERLRAQQADLLKGEPAIRDEMGRLEAVKSVCSSVSGRMRQTVDLAERNITELRRKGDPEVDELVCSTTIVHNQLINLVAEDNAIEDTIYHLHRALNAGRIDLERFLRSARVLAEEQYMKRALIEKIQKGLAMSNFTETSWP